MDPEILIDGHVHLRSGLPLERLLDAAAANFAAASGGHPWRGALWLLEAKGSNDFQDLWESAADLRTRHGGWRLSRLADDDVSLRADHAATGARIDLVAGCQLATIERLEVCAVGTRQVPPDGLSFEDSVQRCVALDALVFVPWGAGKWRGARGQAVERLLCSGQHAGRVFAADNGGRPSFWRRPAWFAALEAADGRVLAGSDPLPLAGEERRVGSFGFRMRDGAGVEMAGRSLVSRLREGAPIEHFGSPLSPSNFVFSQLALRMRQIPT